MEQANKPKSNTMKTNINFILIIGMIFLLNSCSSSTKILGSWKSPDSPPSGYSNIFIAALSDNVLARKTIEDNLQNLLNQKGIASVTSFNIIKPEFRAMETKKEEILNAIKDRENDAILTVAVIDQTNDTRYVPGDIMYNPMGFAYYRGFWRYYSFYYPMIYSPGYYTQEKNYFLEINLYDAQSEDLMWSAQSQTTNPYDLEGSSEEFAKVVVGRLIKEGLIARQR